MQISAIDFPLDHARTPLNAQEVKLAALSGARVGNDPTAAWAA